MDLINAAEPEIIITVANVSLATAKPILSSTYKLFVSGLFNTTTAPIAMTATDATNAEIVERLSAIRFILRVARLLQHREALPDLLERRVCRGNHR